jgi:hypothetical protein
MRLTSTSLRSVPPRSLAFNRSRETLAMRVVQHGLFQGMDDELDVRF